MTTFKVIEQRFEGPWIKGVQTIENVTQWQTGRDGLITAPQVRSRIGGREDMEEKLQWVAMQVKDDSVEASSDRGSFRGVNSGKSDEVGEIAAQSDCIPYTSAVRII
ncbi:hypothetical protein ACMFMG_012115 [Clarireedia jacksonii]